MSDQDENAEIPEESLAQRRTRRTRADKGGRMAALEKLKNLSARGTKNKYEVAEIQNVYDVVDEDTYSRKVNERLKDDWIVDDCTGVTGYSETGRELFDDDLLDEDELACRRRADRNKPKGKKDKQSKEERAKDAAGFLSIRDMLSTMPTKRKRAEAGESSTADSANADDLLGDFMQELREEKKAKTTVPSGLKLLEKTRAAEKFISAGKINEEKPFSSTTPKLTMKKKFPAFQITERPEIKEEPMHGESEQDDIVEDFTPFEDLTESEIIDDFSEDIMNAAVKVEAEAISKAAAESKRGNLQLQEVEDFENYRQVGEDKIEKPTSIPEETSVDMIEATGGEDKLMNFFWFDIYEEPRNAGTLYLFGKVPKGPKSTEFQSCCIILKNVQRCMYVLPRENNLVDDSEVDFNQVYYDFEEVVAKRFKIDVFKSKRTEKKYCFGMKDVPSFSEYLEVRYSGSLPSLPEDLTGNTFSKIFGTNSSLLENLLLEKKLKGPCWLEIKNPVQIEPAQQQSWCKIEFSCEVGSMSLHPKKDKMSPPPFVIASLTVNSVNEASSKKDTIISMNVAVNKSFNIQQASLSSQGLFHDSFCLLNKPVGEVWPFDVDKHLNKQTTKMDSERSMLGCFLAKLQMYDPDVYIGHDLNFDLLLLQLWNHKVPHWSRLGRLKRSSQPQKGGKLPDSRAAIAGRLVCDVKISAKELIRARSYDLPSLSMQVLNMKEDQVLSYTGTEMRQLFETSEGIKHLSNWGMSQSILNIRLVNELQVMPLALQITTIAGNTLSRTLLGGRSERNEFLLLHAFYSKGYIVPDKEKAGHRFKKEPVDMEDGQHNPQDQKSKPSGPSYLGGMVLEPKKGFYDNFIVLMDFLSLYPSIIQEFNICFTTSTTEDSTDTSARGILPEEIRKLVESRREVKKLMQGENVSPDLKRQYDIRQKALKLTANSMYGCLGFRNSRFYAKNLAALITGKGRDILMKTKDTVEKMGYEVIYGDTDSLMINTNTHEIQKVYQIGNKIRTEINRMYKLLELEIDGVFRFLLLLKKKKYAALLYNAKANGEVETTMELKGLDIVRRDWAPVAATTARSILDEIMTEQPLDDKIFKIVKILTEKADELRAGKVPMKELLITKQLAKNPEEYKGRQGLYHVDVALRMNTSGKLQKKFKNGDTVPYLFCTDGLPHHPAELMASKVKAKTEEIMTDNGEEASVKSEEVVLESDPAYYLSQQVHPVVSRICEPIPGLDGARIAEALGLDPSSYKKRRVVEDNREDRALGEISDAEKYRECVRFSFPCRNNECRKEIVVESPFVKIDNKWTFTLQNCPACSTSLTKNTDGHILNRLTLFIRRFVGKYYEGWYMCEDPGCSNRERAVSLHLERGYLACPCQQGVMLKEYSDFDLNKQLNYLLYAFDMSKKREDLPQDDIQELSMTEMRESEIIFERLTAVVKNQLRNSAYAEIRLGHLFMDLIPPNPFSFSSKNSSE